MATQVMRSARRAQLGGSLAKHIDGRSRPEEAAPRDGLPAVEVLAEDWPGAKRALAEARAVRRPGVKPQPAVEVLFAGPPPFESDEAWPRDKVDAWAKATVDWLRDGIGPDAKIAVAALHNDEASPHVHVMLVPATRDVDGRHAGKLRVSWAHVERGLTDDPEAVERRCEGLPPRKRASLVMSSIQDGLHREVSARFGLERGEVGSARKHQPIDRVRGVVGRVLKTPGAFTTRTVRAAAEAAIGLAEKEAAKAAARTAQAAAREAAADAATRAAQDRLARGVAELQRRADGLENRLAAEVDAGVKAADERANKAVAEANKATAAANRTVAATDTYFARREAVLDGKVAAGVQAATDRAAEVARERDAAIERARGLAEHVERLENINRQLEDSARRLLERNRELEEAERRRVRDRLKAGEGPGRPHAPPHRSAAPAAPGAPPAERSRDVPHRRPPDPARRNPAPEIARPR